MLILSRRVGEVICIGHDVRVSVSGIKGSQVRLGIEAPSTVGVDRQEIYERKQSERNSGKHSSKEDPGENFDKEKR